MDIESQIIDAVKIGDVKKFEELLDGEDVEEIISIEVIMEWYKKYCYFRKTSLLRGHRLRSSPVVRGSLLTLSCNLGHVDMAKYLIENCHMDINKSDIVDNCGIKLTGGYTPLWHAVSKNHLEMVKFLIENGANLRTKSMFTTSMGDLLKEKYCNATFNIEMTYDYFCLLEVDDLTPLLLAAIEGYKDIVMYLIAQNELVTLQEKIDALEMLGVYFFYINNMDETVECWRQGLVQRCEYNDERNIIKMLHREPDRTFGNNQEFTNLNDIEISKFDHHKMCCQTVLICERILGPTHPITLAYILYLGHFYISTLRFDDYINLWIYITNAQETLSPEVSIIHALMFVKHYTFLIGYNYGDYIKLDCSILMKYLEQFVIETKRLKPADIKFKTGIWEMKSMEQILLKTLQTSVLILKKIPERDSVEYENFYRIICELVKIEPKGLLGASLLHICNDYLHYHQGNDWDNYPDMNITCPELTELLLQAGCNPNARKEYGNTVLLNLVPHRNPDTAYLEKVKLLLEAGAHLDAENNGAIFQTLLNDNIVFDTLLPLKYTTLRCLAARTINQCNIDFNIVPDKHHQFILQHKYSESTYNFLQEYYKK